MKKELVGSNVVENSSFFDKYYKYEKGPRMVSEVRDEVVVSMKDMLGSKTAVRVSAV